MGQGETMISDVTDGVIVANPLGWVRIGEVLEGLNLGRRSGEREQPKQWTVHKVDLFQSQKSNGPR